MALIPCSDCGKQISTHATSCGHCGAASIATAPPGSVPPPAKISGLPAEAVELEEDPEAQETESTVLPATVWSPKVVFWYGLLFTPFTASRMIALNLANTTSRYNVPFFSFIAALVVLVTLFFFAIPDLPRWWIIGLLLPWHILQSLWHWKKLAAYEGELTFRPLRHGLMAGLIFAALAALLVYGTARPWKEHVKPIENWATGRMNTILDNLTVELECKRVDIVASNVGAAFQAEAHLSNGKVLPILIQQEQFLLPGLSKPVAVRPPDVPWPVDPAYFPAAILIAYMLSQSIGRKMFGQHNVLIIFPIFVLLMYFVIAPATGELAQSGIHIEKHIVSSLSSFYAYTMVGISFCSLSLLLQSGKRLMGLCLMLLAGIPAFVLQMMHAS